MFFADRQQGFALPIPPSDRYGPQPVLPPSLELLFAQPGATLPPTMSVARASNASYFDQIGTLQSAGANVARFDYGGVPGSAPIGLLIEESRTNSLLYSQSFGNAVWLTNAATLTPGYAAGLDASATAARLQLNAGGTQFNTFLHQNVAGTGLGASQTHTVSAWVRSNTAGNQLFALRCSQAGVADHASPDMTATPAWQRFSFAQSFAAGGTGFNAGVVTNAAVAATDLVVWGLQLEVNAPFLTSYIPSIAAAATRAADTVTMPAGNWYSPTAGSLVIDTLVPILTTTAAQVLAEFGDSSVNNRVLLYNNNGPPLAIYNLAGNVTIWNLNFGTAPAGVVNKTGLTMGPAGLAVAVNGGAVASNPGLATTALYNRLTLGSQTTYGSWLDGYVRRVRYWPRVLSNGELQFATT